MPSVDPIINGSSSTSYQTDLTECAKVVELEDESYNEYRGDSNSVASKFFPCDNCPAHFRSQSALDIHIADAHESEMYICEYCRIVKWSHESMSQHLRDVHPDKPAMSEKKRKVLL